MTVLDLQTLPSPETDALPGGGSTQSWVCGSFVSTGCF
ncbi:SapB/AmfS family lanthipeptide [Streptomyces sp. ISL-22]|nr:MULTISPECIES: SapB/AmfS family lanthipeptide [Streptomyces]MBT2423992.1 SapB/AmfS family lanthipeptide [Streptomyces sp. ISL-24]MBT2423993.1 SapB/AmfS family lanthipeptide [Streptomyces sp. ISL-24]MBT2437849.1 SapB/AmfS family lanthipeptide [Streptomyces sp. ISL-22]MBT2437850.1 SapB/AmfS family lanthipeptide [Streptomyces sp. ISL-22]